MMSKTIYSPLSSSMGGSLFDEVAKTGCKDLKQNRRWDCQTVDFELMYNKWKTVMSKSWCLDRWKLHLDMRILQPIKVLPPYRDTAQMGNMFCRSPPGYSWSKMSDHQSQNWDSRFALWEYLWGIFQHELRTGHLKQKVAPCNWHFLLTESTYILGHCINWLICNNFKAKFPNS